MINVLVVNPERQARVIRERFQQLGVQCDVLFCEAKDFAYRLDEDDKPHYRYVYTSLTEILTNPYQLNYQLVIAGSLSGQPYCQYIVEQLGLDGIVMTDNETVTSRGGFRHLASFR